MADESDTTETQNEQTTTDQSAPKGDSPAPDSSDTNSSTTESATTDDGSILNPKTEDAQGDDVDADKGEPDPTAEFYGAPEGDYEITGLPEGETVDADTLAAITPIAKELNLSSTGLSKLAGVYAEKVLPGVAEQVAAGINAQVAELRAGWATEARTAVQGGKDADGNPVAADTVYGGKTLGEVQQVSAKALDRFGGTEFREFLEANGLGNHPQMLRFAYQAGALLSEDTNLDRTRGAPDKPLTREEKFYGRKD